MPLPVLVILVAGGMALVGGLVWWFFRDQVTRLDSETAAADAWQRAFPGPPLVDILLDDNGAVAIGRLPDKAVGLVWLMGADTTARHLTLPADIFDTGDGLRINLGDFAAPSVTATLSDNGKRAEWLNMLTTP